MNNRVINVRWNIYAILIICIILFVIALNYAAYKGPAIIGNCDGALYFSYLRSVIIDHDLDFNNDYQLLHFPYPIAHIADGRVVNPTPFGIAILWFPFYIIAHIVTLSLNGFGLNIPANGISTLYLASIIFSTWCYGILGILFCYKLCRNHFPIFISAVVVISVFCSSSLLYYLVFDPFFAHIGSFFSITSFIFYWNKTRINRTLLSWLFLGLLSGLMILVRWQNCIFAFILLVDFVESGIKSYQTKDFIAIKKLGLNAILYTAIVFLILIPQFLFWNLFYGKFITIPQGSRFILWQYPMLSEILFSSRNGLFSWNPLAWFGFIGFIFYYKKDRRLTIYLLLMFLLMLYINSCVADWWGGGGFGMRRFDGFIILLSLGVATLITRMKDWIQKYPMLVIGIILFGFISWNFALVRQFNNRQINPGDTISWNKVANNQIEYTSRKFGYPFSYPANIWFSTKYHTSPEKYDIVAGKYLDFWDFQLHSIIEFYSIDPAFLKQGWSYPQDYYEIPVRWADKPESSLFVTLRYPTDYMATLHVLPFSYPNAPMQSITIMVNQKEAATISLENLWKEYTVSIPKSYWYVGINELRFKYAYAISPIQVISGNPDTRTLAVCWHYLKLERL